MRGPKPYGAYQGIVSVRDITDWFDRYGLRLFEQNIRQPLGLTNVNKELIDTLTGSPWDFWYFNNGITVLCVSAEVRPLILTAPDGPCEVTLKGASVVNGAQTVMAIQEAIRAEPDRAGRASVSLKIITTVGRPVGFGTSVTKATNTQNRVESRDFVALDDIQRTLREDFALSLHKEYVYKRGEPDPEPGSGTSVAQVTLALACAHSNLELAVRAKINRDTLWERGRSGTYEVLFLSEEPTEWQAWRSVQVLRKVQGWLGESLAEREGRASAIADYGELLIAHLVFRMLPYDLIGDPQHDWDREVARVPELAREALAWLVHRVDQIVGPGVSLKGVFSSVDQCRTLVDLVLADLQADEPTPELSPAYRPTRRRRPNAVATLVDAHRIADGATVVFQTRSRESIRRWMAGWQRIHAVRRQPGSTIDSSPCFGRMTVTVTRHRLSSLRSGNCRAGPTHRKPCGGLASGTSPTKGSLWELAKKIQDEEQETSDG